MKPMEKPESKTSSTVTNANQKRKYNTPETMGEGSSLLKKNEFTLIIAGALVVTLIVFFVFFKSAGPKPQATSGLSPTSGSSVPPDLEKRIGAIESVLETLQAKGAGSLEGTPAAPGDLAPLQQKVERIETIVSVKLDSLIERMGKMEKQIHILDQKSLVVPAAVAPSAPEPSSQKKPLVKKTAGAPGKKAVVTPANKASMFHTVQKGETLWSISRKYKTTVANIRKLNNMPANATIYPGINILVR